MVPSICSDSQRHHAVEAARGQPLLSEGTLLLLNLSPQSKQDGKASHESSGEDPVYVAKKLRPKFQLALLGWIQGGDTKRHLETLSGVISALETSANRNDMHQLWWVVGGVLESLQNGGLETSVALKRLLGQTDRQIKLLIDEGIGAFDNHPVADLLKTFFITLPAPVMPANESVKFVLHSILQNCCRATNRLNMPGRPCRHPASS